MTEYNVSPPPELLLPFEEQASLRAYLSQAPGVDIHSSFAQGATDSWPQDGLHVSTQIRPGFNGNIAISPYRGAYCDAEGNVDLEGIGGRFYMIYENPRYQSDAHPSDRIGPDYVPMSQYDTIPLQNAGRLLVSQRRISQGCSTSSFRVSDDQHSQAVRVERLVTPRQTTALLAHLATGMALSEVDTKTWIIQPSQKIDKLRPKGFAWLVSQFLK